MLRQDFTASRASAKVAGRRPSRCSRGCRSRPVLGRIETESFEKFHAVPAPDLVRDDAVRRVFIPPRIRLELTPAAPGDAQRRLPAGVRNRSAWRGRRRRCRLRKACSRKNRTSRRRRAGAASRPARGQRRDRPRRPPRRRADGEIGEERSIALRTEREVAVEFFSVPSTSGRRSLRADEGAPITPLRSSPRRGQGHS